MIEMVAEYGSVIMASTLRLFVGIGLSLAYNHEPVELWLLTSTGSIIGVSSCLFLGKKIQFLLLTKWIKKEVRADTFLQKSPSLLRRIWQKYGLLGLAVVSLFVGTIPSVAIALVSNLRRRSIFLYLVSGKLVWTSLIAIVGKMPF